MRRNSRVAGCEEMQLIYSEVAGNCSGKSGSSGRWAEENCCCRKLLLQFLLFLCARRNVCNIIFALLAAAGWIFVSTQVGKGERGGIHPGKWKEKRGVAWLDMQSPPFRHNATCVCVCVCSCACVSVCAIFWGSCSSWKTLLRKVSGVRKNPYSTRSVGLLSFSRFLYIHFFHIFISGALENVAKVISSRVCHGS